MSIARQKFPVQCIKYFSILNCGVCKLQVNFRWMVSNGWYQMDPDSYENMHHINTDSYENVYQMDPNSYINIHHMDPDTYKNIHRMDPDSYMKTYITYKENRIYIRGEFTRKKCKTAILLDCFYKPISLHIFMLYNCLGPGI